MGNQIEVIDGVLQGFETLHILETVSHISRFAKLSLLFPKNDFLSGSFDGRMQLEGFSISVTVPAFDSSNEEGCKACFFLC